MALQYKKIIPAMAATILAAAVFAGILAGSTRVADRAPPVHARGAEIQLSPEVEKAFSAQFDRFTRYDERRGMIQMDLVGEDGRAYDLAEDHGHYVLIHFWATWCPPCVTELPLLGKFYEQTANSNLKIITISLDYDPPYERVKSFMVKNNAGGMPLYLVSKESKAWDELASFSLPVSFLVGVNGDVLYKMSGSADWVSPETQAFFSSFMVKNPSAGR